MGVVSERKPVTGSATGEEADADRPRVAVAIGTGHVGVAVRGEETVVHGVTWDVRDRVATGALDPDYVVPAGYGDMERENAEAVAESTGAAVVDARDDAPTLVGVGPEDVTVVRRPTRDGSALVLEVNHDGPETTVVVAAPTLSTAADVGTGVRADALLAGEADIGTRRLEGLAEHVDTFVTGTAFDAADLEAIAASETVPGKGPVRVFDGGMRSPEPGTEPFDVTLTPDREARQGLDVEGTETVGTLLVFDALAESYGRAGIDTDRAECLRAARETYEEDARPGEPLDLPTLNGGIRDRLDTDDELLWLLEESAESRLRRHDLRARLLSARDALEREAGYDREYEANVTWGEEADEDEARGQ